MADPAATTIAARHLSLRPRGGTDVAPAADLSLEEAERVFIEKVLARHNGDVRLAVGAARHEPERALPAVAAIWRPRVAARRKVHWSLEQAVVGLSLLGGLPAAVALVYLVWGQNYSFEVRWTLAAVVLVVWVGCALTAYQMVTRVALSRGQPAGRAARRGLLHPRDRRQAGQRRRSRDEGDQLARQHAAAAALRSGRVDGPADERHGGDRRRGLRVRHGREAASWPIRAAERLLNKPAAPGIAAGRHSWREAASCAWRPT